MTGSSEAPRICDVAPRDGLQTLARRFTSDERADLIGRLIAAGLRHVEVGSFVHPERVPQMADLEALLGRIDKPAGVRFAGLAMNRRGVERALATGLDEVRLVLVATETFSRRNQRATPGETLAMIAEAAPRLRAAGKEVTVIVAAAFGCPFEGPVSAGHVTGLAARAVEAGADTLLFADTIGCGVPPQVRALAAWARGTGLPFGFHFHDTRNTGIANAWVAVEEGASLLDAATGGIGGCPFAPGATGNIATEDLAWMLRQAGQDTGLDLTALHDIATWLGTRVPGAIASRLHRAGAYPETAAMARADTEGAHP